MIVSVVGNIGAGKSSLSKYFEKKEFNLISVDELGHNLLLKKNVIQKTVKLFGEGVLRKNGKLDRKKISSLVFSNKKLIKKYNEIIHPLLILQIKKNLKKRKPNLIDAALYYELELDKISDYVILVRATKKLVEERIMNKEFLKRQKFIKPVKVFDFLVNNNKDKKYLMKKAEEIHHKIVEGKK